MQAPPLYFGTGTIDGDEEGGALGKENGNDIVEDEEDGEDELGTWNLELGTLNFALGSAAYMSEASLKKGVGRLKELGTLNFKLGTWNFALGYAAFTKALAD